MSAERLVGALGEFTLISRLTANLRFASGVIGPGDDCAVIPNLVSFSTPGFELLTTDVLVEGVHFDLSYTKPFDLGWKVIAVSLSDIAAMGGQAKGVVLGLTLRPNLEISWVEEFYRGARTVLDKYNVTLLGGDTVSGRELSFTATILGHSSLPPILRSGASVGEDVWISGQIGAALMGLLTLSGKTNGKLFGADTRISEEAHLRPDPRLSLGQVLLQSNLATAMIDVSDGLLQDAEHIAERSGVTMKLDPTLVPIFSGVSALGLFAEDALSGGEDYELLFTARREERGNLEQISGRTLGFEQAPQLTRIGEVLARREEKVLISQPNNLVISALSWLQKRNPQRRKLGFDHFG